MSKMQQACVCVFLTLFFLTLSLTRAGKEGTKIDRVYKQGEQFPMGSDKLILPHMVVFSIFMGVMKYEFTQLTLESMRWNPQVHHVFIQIVEADSEAERIVQLANQMAVPNFFIKIMTIEQWKQKVTERLGIVVPFDKSWFYKLCDYKPVLARMFPEYVNKTVIGKPGELFYKYWGYADMDVIWGSFQKYAHWFQGKFPFVVSGWFGTTGAAAFYKNEPWTQDLFLLNDRFITLLKDKEYHNLDEGGTQTDPKFVVDGGKHAISWIQKTWVSTHGSEFNYGKVWQDHCFIDSGDSNDWAGPVTWSHGRLRIVKGNPQFPPGRDLLFYHRPDSSMRLSSDAHMRQQILRDMADYGFVLPNWIPLMTRFVCKEVTRASMDQYKPFAAECYGKNAHDVDRR